jgi:SAM-dependent methyltransferase
MTAEAVGMSKVSDLDLDKKRTVPLSVPVPVIEQPGEDLSESVSYAIEFFSSRLNSIFNISDVQPDALHLPAVPELTGIGLHRITDISDKLSRTSDVIPANTQSIVPSATQGIVLYKNNITAPGYLLAAAENYLENLQKINPEKKQPEETLKHEQIPKRDHTADIENPLPYVLANVCYKTYLKDVEKPVVLDIGTGSGKSLEELAFDCEIIGVDFNVESLKKNKKAKCIYADATNLGIGDETADMIILSEVISYNPGKAKEILDEAYRCAKPGAIIIATFEADENKEFSAHYKDFEYYDFEKLILTFAQSKLVPVEMFYQSSRSVEPSLILLGCTNGILPPFSLYSSCEYPERMHDAQTRLSKWVKLSRTCDPKALDSYFRENKIRDPAEFIRNLKYPIRKYVIVAQKEPEPTEIPIIN